MKHFGIALSLAAGCVVSDDDGIIEQAATVVSTESYTGNPVVAVSRAELVLTDGVLAPADGSDIVGRMIQATLESGDLVRVRVEGVEPIETRSGELLTGYRVTYSVNGAIWATLCGTPDNLAVAIDGRWDYTAGVLGAGGPIADSDSFLFACREAAIERCIELGYAPWARVRSGSLQNHHTACVRMMRADYCGDGRSWREHADLLEVSDGVGVNPIARTWSLEAMWGARGATCAARRSFDKRTPSCWEQITAWSCDGEFAGRTLLISTLPRLATPPQLPPGSQSTAVQAP